MASAPRILTCALLLTALLALIPGCSGGSSTSTSPGSTAGSLTVVLQYVDPPTRTEPGEVVVGRLPDLATRFLVELLDQNSLAVRLSQEVNRQPGESQTVTFPLVPLGNFLLRVTAYDAAGTVLGVYTTPVTVQAGSNTFPVSTVTPTPSPSPSPSPAG